MLAALAKAKEAAIDWTKNDFTFIEASLLSNFILLVLIILICTTSYASYKFTIYLQAVTKKTSPK